MSPVFALSDVDPQAITLCKRGANRQRIFLKKEHAPDDQLLQLTPAPILRKSGDDWSVFYCVVAEPGAQEDPGLVGDADSTDVWASEDEIRKACHRLSLNKAYVNLVHDGPEAPACRIVENAVALADMDVVDPGGTSQTIRKGSWYIAVMPDDDTKQLIESGDVQAVSMEGTGLRTMIEKAEVGKPGTNWTQVTPAHRKKIEGLVRFYMKKPHPFTACVRDNTKRFGPDGAKRVCAVVKDMGRKTTKWRNTEGIKKAKAPEDMVSHYAQRLYEAGVNSDAAIDHFGAYVRQQRQAASSMDATALQKLAAKVGLADDPDVRAAIAKEATTFDAVMAQRELEDELPSAFDVLRSVIWRTFYPYGDNQPDDAERRQIIEQSLQEFGTHLLGLLDATTGDTGDLRKVLGSLGINDNEPEASVLTSEERAELDALKKSGEDTTNAIGTLSGLVEKLVDKVGELSKAPEPVKKSDDTDPVKLLGTICDRMDGIDADVQTIAKSIRDGAAVQTAHDDTAPAPVRKSADPLAGLLA